MIAPNNKAGIFGNVKHYYGVLEAQSRGSLHLHLLIWVEGTNNPDEKAELITSNEDFKIKLVEYLAAVI